MRLTAIGKVLILILAIGIGIGGWRMWKRTGNSFPNPFGSPQGDGKNEPPAQKQAPQNIVPPDQKPTGAANEILFVFPGGKKSWLQDPIARFNEQQNGKYKVVTAIYPSREGMHAILNGSIKPVLWSPDSTMWSVRLGQVWKKNYATNLIDTQDANSYQVFLRSPLVFLTTQQKAHFLRPLLGSSQTWTRLRELSLGHKRVPWGKLRFSHADPLVSNSGIMMLGLILYDYSERTGENANLEKVANSAKFLAYLRELEKGLVYDEAAEAGTSELTKAFVKSPDRYDFIIAYENAALDIAAKNPDFAVIYPSPTAISEHAISLLNAGWITPTQREGARAFLAFLGSPEMLADGVKQHYRPAQSNGELSLNAALSSHSAQGFRQSFSSIELPTYNALNAAAFQWRVKIAGKPAN